MDNIDKTIYNVALNFKSDS